VTDLSATFVDALVKAARLEGTDRLLIVGNAPALAKKLKKSKAKVIFAVTEARDAEDLADNGFATVMVPAIRGSRTDRLKSALVAALNAGVVERTHQVAVGIATDEGLLDMLVRLTAEDVARDHESLEVAHLQTRIPAPLLEVLVDLALRIGREGYEGRPIGTLIIVGDSTAVLEQSAPLTLNPFQGYSEQERNLFDHEVRAAVRTFAMLDGAFVVREDGVVLAAGRHIRVSATPREMPLGYGARHVAAAAVTLQTEAVAIAVSQSSGRVRVFDKGELALELDPGGRRGSSEPRPPLPPRPPRRPPFRSSPSDDVVRRRRRLT
jgi:DNA integrity scanning protein DisA with diadenylate cyclase activity